MTSYSSKRLLRIRRVIGSAAIAALITLAWCTYPAFEREMTVRALKRSGAQFAYELFPAVDGPPGGGESAAGTSWYQRFTQSHVFDKPVEIQFSEGVDEASAALLSDLPTLKSIVFVRCVLTDDVVRELSRCREIVLMRLYRCRIAPSAVMSWKNLTHIESLEVSPVPTGMSLSELLSEMQSLQHLYIRAIDNSGAPSAISLDGLTVVPRPEAMRTIRITGQELLGDFAVFQKFTGLESLALCEPNLKAENLQKLTEVRQLASLSLKSCGLTDKHVESLLQRQNFQKLDLSENSISPAGIARLGDGLKGCTIRYGTIGEGHCHVPGD